MKLLLDTQILVWSQLEPEKVPSRAAEALEDGKNEMWFSPVSIWEMLQLIQRGRISVKGDPFKWVDQVVGDLQEAVLNRHVAAQSRRVEVPHNDPADRFIAATAQVYELTLVTADTKLRKTPGLNVFDI